MSKISFLICALVLLTSCGGGGSGSGGNSGGSNPPTNNIPTVNAGNDQSVDEQTSVTLTGSASDSDGTISGYSWTQTGGTTVTLSNDTSASASFTAPDISVDETLTFNLTVTDNSGANANDTVSIIVKRVNQSPIVTISTDSISIDESSSIVISHSAKDYQNTTIASELSCDVGTLNGDTYTAPSVATETTATCAATATDSGNRTTTEKLILTIKTVTPVLALANSETSATTAKLTTIDVSFANVSEGLMDATLNGEEIKLGVTSDNKLVYFPALSASGKQTLIVELEGEIVNFEYDVLANSNFINDTSVYVADYLTKLRLQIDQQITIAQSKGLSSTEIQYLNEIKNNFDVSLISELTSDELDLLAYLIDQNISQLYPDEINTLSSTYYSKSNLASVKILTLSSCEISAISAVAAGGTAYLSTLATAALAKTVVGIPKASIAIMLSAISWNVFDYSLDKFGEHCFEWAQTDLNNINSTETQTLTGKNKSHKFSTPTKTSKAINEVVDFFHNEERTFVATRKYQILSGAEAYITSVINSVNKVRGVVIDLVNLIGENNAPVFILDYIENPLEINDYLYEQIDPSFLTMSSISSTDVEGYMLVNGDSFTLKFDIQDLNQSLVTFQFSLIDSTIENGTSVIDAEVTLNPPIAYNTTFEVVKGGKLTARLLADFETGFEIKQQPQKGTLNIDGAFSFPGGGLFIYTPDNNFTEDTVDTFTFVATNGSAINNGQSNIATVTINVNASDKYTIELTHSDTQEVFAELSEGDLFTHPNGSYAMVRIKLNGQPVATDALSNGMGYWADEPVRLYMPSRTYQQEDVTFTYTFALYDRTNNVPVNIPVTYTISNQAYRTLIGGTFPFSGDGVYVYGFESGSTITFNADGTFEARASNGDVGQIGSYRWENQYPTYSTFNGNFCGPDINSEIIGQVTFSLQNGTAYVGIKKGGALYDYRCKLNF